MIGGLVTGDWGLVTGEWGLVNCDWGLQMWECTKGRRWFSAPKCARIGEWSVGISGWGVVISNKWGEVAIQRLDKDS